MGVHIIIINGKGGSGKDTFVEQANKIANEEVLATMVIHNISAIDKIKSAASYLGWDQQKTLKGRKLLADIKLALDEYDEDLITKGLITQCNDLCLKHYLLEHLLIFVHIREPRNIDKFINIAKESELNNKCKLYTLLITNPSTDDITYGNEGDDMVSNYKYDFIITNDGTIDNLKNKAKGLVNGVILYDCPFGNK